MAAEARPELVGKRFLCVSGDEPPGSGDIGRWPWRSGVIRAVSHRDNDNPDLTLDWSWWSEGQQKPGVEAHRGGGLRDSGNLVWRLTVVGAEGQRRPGVEAHRGGLSDSRNLVLRLTVVGG
ncbi:unnamed protein product [Arctogadus glacialis]